MENIVEQHKSADGKLTLKVERLGDADVCIGFDGYPWHTHADILASISGLTKDEAVRQYIDDVLNGRAVITVLRANSGEIRDVWIADKAIPDKYKAGDETIEFRFWDGRPVARS